MNIRQFTLSNTVDRETVYSVSKLLLAVLSLIFVLYLLTLLPGLDRLIPQTPVTFVALVGAIVTMAVVALLLYAAPKAATLTRMAIGGPQAVVEHLSSVVYWLVVLAAVLVAHRGFAGAVTPLLDGLTWVYDLVFLLFALPAVAVIAARLYASLDPSAELFADKITGADENGDEDSEVEVTNPDRRLDD